MAIISQYVRATLLTPAFLGFTCSMCLAQDEQSEAAKQNPNAISGLKIDLGFLAGLKRAQGESFYYRVEYKGKVLQARGEPFREGVVNPALTVPGTGKKVSSGEDANEYELLLERGGVSVANHVFNGIGLKQFTIPSRFLRELRGAVQISGLLDGRQTNIAFGLETPPVHPIRYINRSANLPNWLVVGLAQEKRNGDSVTGGDRNVTLGTFRAFVGKGIGPFVRSRVREAEADQSIANVVKLAPTFTQGYELYRAMRRDHRTPNDSEAIVQSEVSVVGETISDSALQRKFEEGTLSPDELTAISPSTDDWKKRLLAHVDDFYSLPDQPRAAIWLESGGWYTINGPIDIRRLQAMAAATLQWWPDQKRAKDYWLKARYENGFQRAAPVVRRHFFSLAVGTYF